MNSAKTNKDVVRKGKRRGFLLLTAYLFVSSFSILSLALFARGTTHLAAAERNLNRVAAFNMAETGIDRVLAAYRLNPAIPNYGGTSYQDFSAGKLTGGYQIVVNNTRWASVKEVRVTGYSPSNNAQDRAYESRTITSYINVDTGLINLFQNAVYGAEKVTINGRITTNSYNSSTGATNLKNGHLATGSISSAVGSEALSIAATGFSTINGNLTVGAGANTGTAISLSGPVTLNGSRNDIEPQTVDLPKTNRPSAGSLTINGTTVTTSTGVSPCDPSVTTRCLLKDPEYRFDSLKIQGGAQVDLWGQTKIFVDGDTSILGSRVNLKDETGVFTNYNPKNFRLYSKGDSVTLSPSNAPGGSSMTLRAAIYAPNAKITTEKAPLYPSRGVNLYGALVGEEYELNGRTTLNFDEDLKNVQENFSGPSKVISWSDEPSTSWSMGSAPSQTTSQTTSVSA